MQELRAIIQEIKQNVRNGIKDHSLVGQLQHLLIELRLNLQIVQPYCQLLFKLYDLSNSPHFLDRAPHPKVAQNITLDPLAIAIKGVVLRMLSALVSYFNQSSSIEISPSMISQALQIMIMVSRVLLDVDQFSQVRKVYGMVMTFRQAMGIELAFDVEIAHWLNLLELMAIDIDAKNMEVSHFKNTLNQLNALISDPKAPQSYLPLIQHITFEVVLKLLKKCRSSQANLLMPYLNEKMQSTIKSLMTLELPETSEQSQQLKLSPFYQVYLQIMKNGYKNIEESSLRMFVSEQNNFNDSRIFDVIALTGQSSILEMWFELQLKIKAQPEQKQKAYQCFVYLIDKGLYNIDNRQGSLESCREQDLTSLGKLAILSRVVMVSMLSDKKQTNNPIALISKRLCKLLTYLVMHLHPEMDSIRQYAQKLLLICNKHNLSQLSKSIVTIHFYYQLLMGTVNQQSYGQFCRTNLVDKGSQLFRCLKLAYLFRAGKSVPKEEEKDLLIKQPFIMILFAQEPQDQIILRFPPRQMVRIVQKWQIYLMILDIENNTANHEKLLKILAHLEQTLINDDWSKISVLDVGNMEHLTGILMSLFIDQKQNINSQLKTKLSVVLMYLINIVAFSKKLDSISSAVLLNKYSKLVRLITLGRQQCAKLQEDQRMKYQEKLLYLSKILICSLQESLKVQYLQNESSNQPGLLVLVDTIYENICRASKITIGQLQFYKFVRFQILCLLDGYSDSQIYQESSKMLKLYCSSVYIPKQLKLKIMRKLIREQLISDSKLLSFSDVVELIQIAENTQEKQIFASYLIRTFGDEGRKYIMMESERNPNTFGFLQDEDDYL